MGEFVLRAGGRLATFGRYGVCNLVGAGQGPWQGEVVLEQRSFEMYKIVTTVPVGVTELFGDLKRTCSGGCD